MTTRKFVSAANSEGLSSIRTRLSQGCGEDMVIKSFHTYMFGDQIGHLPNFGKCDKEGLCSKCEVKLALLNEIETIDNIEGVGVGNEHLILRDKLKQQLLGEEQ